MNKCDCIDRLYKKASELTQKSKDLHWDAAEAAQRDRAPLYEEAGRVLALADALRTTIHFLSKEE